MPNKPSPDPATQMVDLAKPLTAKDMLDLQDLQRRLSHITTYGQRLNNPSPRPRRKSVHFDPAIDAGIVIADEMTRLASIPRDPLVRSLHRLIDLEQEPNLGQPDPDPNPSSYS